MTDFYMKRSTGLKWVKDLFSNTFPHNIQKISCNISSPFIATEASRCFLKTADLIFGIPCVY